MCLMCCAVLCRETGDPIGAAALFLRGFSSVKALLPAESRHLRVLVASRLAATCTLGAYSQQFVSMLLYVDVFAFCAVDVYSCLLGCFSCCLFYILLSFLAFVL